jgi:hypothetical protein
MEEWKRIEGFEYEVSNTGNVRRYGSVKNIAQIKQPNRTYVMLWKDGKQYCRKVHRLLAQAFILNPENYYEIDHINNNPNDNRIENLRWCNRQQNALNVRKHKDNKSGFKGVCCQKGRFVASITYQGKKYSCGSYNTAEEAFEAYKEKALKLHKDFCKF